MLNHSFPEQRRRLNDDMLKRQFHRCIRDVDQRRARASAATEASQRRRGARVNLAQVLKPCQLSQFEQFASFFISFLPFSLLVQLKTITHLHPNPSYSYLILLIDSKQRRSEATFLALFQRTLYRPHRSVLFIWLFVLLCRVYTRYKLCAGRKEQKRRIYETVEWSQIEAK